MQFLRGLGGPFLVCLSKVQDELKLTAEQRENLDEALQGRFDDAVKLIQKLGGVNPEERRITV